MSEETKKKEDTELSEQDLDNVAGGMSKVPIVGPVKLPPFGGGGTGPTYPDPPTLPGI